MAVNKRRVVVTGLGLVSPLGIGAKYVWNKLLGGHSGVTSLIPLFPGVYDKLPITIAGVVPRSKEESSAPFIPEEWLRPGVSAIREKDRFATVSQYAMCAAIQAIEDANLEEFKHVDKERVGPNHSTSTACTTGAHSIGDASRFIEYGDADIMVAGATEAPLDPLAISGFNKLKALTNSYNDNPQIASKPFDFNRSGFVMGEGSGIVILEELEHAKARNAKIYAELRGYGLSGDANHITLPSSDGRGAKKSMSMALKRANLEPRDVDYINAHATSTPIGIPSVNIQRYPFSYSK
ncbi:3-oxoacyl-[acyl-carrier-protein] synthase, mitochondrial [Smittium mucronatum]|uniref:beta-ketoacyl-[acyl-carrier-protein] synthase I n=1 Tax=Smittium mucronatum TaxID=133383 RepID=A0A1R0GL69_9FUNG|nr:3-oxoacyl-[acyl-carrier-protein] synthase, mitochondrial [Smittium mucronatum]